MFIREYLTRANVNTYPVPECPVVTKNMLHGVLHNPGDIQEWVLHFPMLVCAGTWGRIGMSHRLDVFFTEHFLGVLPLIMANHSEFTQTTKDVQFYYVTFSYCDVTKFGTIYPNKNLLFFKA